MADSPGSRRRQPHASQRHSQQQANTSTESTNSSARPDRDNEGLTRRRSSSPSKAGMTSTAATPGAGESSSSAASSKARPDRKRPSSPAWDEAASSSGNPGEESMILRRREANRLAAQRFRNRKKGYQDSLEERIRVLEEERAILNRRLEDAEEGHAGRGYHGPHGGEHLMRRFDQSPSVLAGAPGRSASTSRLSRFASPSAADAELRVASLESANRRLQDELKRASERISYLESNLDQWVKWEQNLRYQSADAAGDINRRRSPRQPSPRISVPTALPPPLPPAASPIVHQGPRRPVSPVRSPPRLGYDTRSPYPSAPPHTAPPAAPSYSAQHYGRERSSSVGMGGLYHGRSGVQLPPLQPPPHGLSPPHPHGGPPPQMYSPYHERPPPTWSPPRDLGPHGPRGHPSQGHSAHPSHGRRYD